jgi:Metallo-beta-lactamase superfamily
VTQLGRSPPLPDLIEVTVIGPGFGESIVIHVGSNQWVIVDSCVDSRTRAPAALAYLNTLGVDPSVAVKLIVASHWHDDHIGGMSVLLEACPAADFVCSAALSTKEFLGISCTFNESPLSRSGSGVGEIQRSFLCTKRRRRAPRWVVGNRLIRMVDETKGETICEITALSPTDHEFSRFLGSLAKLMPQRGTTKYRMPSPTPNDISVALWFKVGTEDILLGADLEEHGDSRRGWTAVIASRDRPKGLAGFYKVAHHGSVTAHHDGIWTELLAAGPVAVLTPWNRGRKLPTAADRDRINGLTPNAYATSRANPSPIRHIQAVEKVLREGGIKISRAEPITGFVRARKSTKGGSWEIDASPNAVPLGECV